MSNAGVDSYPEFIEATQSSCGSKPGFTLHHAADNKKTSRYYVDVSNLETITLVRSDGDEQALDSLPESIALNIVAAWLRNGMINTLASTAPKKGEPSICIAR